MVPAASSWIQTTAPQNTHVSVTQPPPPHECRIESWHPLSCEAPACNGAAPPVPAACMQRAQPQGRRERTHEGYMPVPSVARKTGSGSGLLSRRDHRF
eukprot:262621-Chlamydomonas_euryale.AAC.3